MSTVFTQGEYERRVVDALSAGVREWLAATAAAGRDPRILGKPDALADRMLAALPAPHPWDEQIGPFYDTPRLVKLLGVSKQAIADRVQRRTLLAMRTRSGRIVYPTFQFDGRHVRHPITELLTEFERTSADGWAIASWFTTPAAALDATTPLEWLDRGRDRSSVRAAAEDTARRWMR